MANAGLPPFLLLRHSDPLQCRRVATSRWGCDSRSSAAPMSGTINLIVPGGPGQSLRPQHGDPQGGHQSSHRWPRSPRRPPSPLPAIQQGAASLPGVRQCRRIARAAAVAAPRLGCQPSTGGSASGGARYERWCSVRATAASRSAMPGLTVSPASLVTAHARYKVKGRHHSRGTAFAAWIHRSPVLDRQPPATAIL